MPDKSVFHPDHQEQFSPQDSTSQDKVKITFKQRIVTPVQDKSEYMDESRSYNNAMRNKKKAEDAGIPVRKSDQDQINRGKTGAKMK